MFGLSKQGFAVGWQFDTIIVEMGEITMSNLLHLAERQEIVNQVGMQAAMAK